MWKMTAGRCSRAMAHRAAVLGLCAVLAAGSACSRETTARQVADESDRTGTMELEDDHVKGGDEISVTLGRSEGDPDELTFSTALTLKETDGRPLYRLYWLDGSAVVPYKKVEDVRDEGTPALSTGGPYRFRVPPVEPGPYLLCVGYLIIGPGTGEEEPPDGEEPGGEACADLTVEA